MSFAQPWMLWGALAAAIPLLVHLFDRRRPRPHPFAPLAFVLRSQKRTASRLKLKRLLLYALRTLLLIAIPVALARPQLTREAAAAAAQKGPAATAVVLDASLSMRWAEGGTSLFERGRDEARDALADLLPEEPATVLLCTEHPQAPPAPGFDRGRLRGVLDDAQPGMGAADMTRCLDLAARALEDSPLAGKRLVVVSDLTQAAFRLEAPAPTLKGPDGRPVRPEVVLRDAAKGRDALPNHALVDLKVEPAPQAGARAFQFTFTVKNFSAEPVRDLAASVRVGESVLAKGFVEVGAGGTAQKALTVRFPQGGTVTGEVVLAPDALPDDDRRAFVLPVPRGLKALVVNGSPHATRYRDEAFFVEAALRAPGSPVEVAVRDPEAGLREDLSGYDVVFLLNASAPGAAEAKALQAFVEAGGGLFVSVGDHVDPDAYNARLGPLLPRPLRVVRTAAERDAPDAEGKAARLAQVQTEHPLFAPFTGPAGEGLLSSRFYRYVLLEAERGGGGDAQMLATYTDGAPALAVVRRGRGRVALLTTTVDRDWADFAIRTSFLPLMQRMAAYLAGALEEREEVRAAVGESVTLPAPEPRPDAPVPSRVRSPSGAEVPVATVTAQGAEGGAQARVAGPLTEAGVHQVLDGNGQPIPALAFAAALPPGESDLTRLSPDALGAHFGQDVVQAARSDADGQQVPLWTWLLTAGVLFLFFEGLLLRK